jgi:hypothetical protein
MARSKAPPRLCASARGSPDPEGSGTVPLHSVRIGPIPLLDQAVEPAVAARGSCLEAGFHEDFKESLLLDEGQSMCGGWLPGLRQESGDRLFQPTIARCRRKRLEASAGCISEGGFLCDIGVECGCWQQDIPQDFQPSRGAYQGCGPVGWRGVPAGSVIPERVANTGWCRGVHRRSERALEELLPDVVPQTFEIVV